jgi:hypothetical protein
MPNPLTLPIGPGFSFKDTASPTTYKVSDHNRSEIDISYDRVENRKRMADGTMRTFVVAQKRSWKASWKDLPREDVQTADGFMGAASLKSWYDSHLGSFQLVITDGENSTETVLVMFDSFICTLSKRSIYTDLYNVEMALVEV